MTPETLASVRDLLDVLVQNERRAIVSAASRIVLDAASRATDEGRKAELTALSVEISALTPVYTIPTAPSATKPSSLPKGSPDAVHEADPPDRPRVRPVGRKRSTRVAE